LPALCPGGQGQACPELVEGLERWHRTFRDQFLSELDESRIADLDDLNARLWAWIEQIYHRTPHEGLGGQTPLARYQQDLPNIRTLGQRAAQLDAIFFHRMSRFVRQDGAVSYQGSRFEVPYELAGKTVRLVVDPHAHRVAGIEDEEGNTLGAATPLDAEANRHRRRRKPDTQDSSGQPPTGPNLVEWAYRQYHGRKED
jgi:putative transposase